MSYPINYPTPQGANVQIFRNSQGDLDFTWVKPQGASFVWFTLIGAGGGGGSSDGTTANGGGGGSGAVTNCMVPAFLIPDSLTVRIGSGGIGGNAGGVNGGSGTPTTVSYKGKAATSYDLLGAAPGSGGKANGGGGGAGGTTDTSNFFSCIGIYQNVIGQNGFQGAAISASTTTFLSGGSSNTSSGTVNYGYAASSNGGFFQMQPIIVGAGGAQTAYVGPATLGGIGCGGAGVGVNATSYKGGNGGDGLVVIITW